MGSEQGAYFSRFTVMSEQEKAWAMDAKFHLYVYDGMRFWRRRNHSTRYVIVPAWRTPSYGWMHAADCTCRLCAPASQKVARAA